MAGVGLTLVFLSLVAACTAVHPNYAPYWWGYTHHGGYPYFAPYFWGYPGHFPGYYPQPQRMAFYGKFAGTCEGSQDGLYYIDDRSFAFCSNGQKSIQSCAEGSANPPLKTYKEGDAYGFYDFCSVNLVARGYDSSYQPVYPTQQTVYADKKKPVYPTQQTVYADKRENEY